IAAALAGDGLAQARGRIAAAAREGRGFTAEFSFADGEAAVDCELTVAPLGDGRALVVARYGGFDRSLREALVDSRKRYKDFVEISSEFVWETAADGRFAFVSPQGALGWTADQLVGRMAESFLLADEGPRTSWARSPFRAEQPVADAEIWFRRADGAMACLSTSARPLYEADGRWTGARGVCRDVSALRERDSRLARAHTREKMFGYIVRAMREEAEPAKMLALAAEAVARALAARGVEIHRIGAGGPLRVACHGESSPLGAAGPIAACLRRPGVVGIAGDGAHQIAVATRWRDGTNGAVMAWRDAVLGAFDEEERALAAEAAGHIGLALEQIAAHEQLQALSSTDSLTGLLNRRSFMAELSRRFERTAGGNGGGALVYCDLDNFKQVNDTHGHERGDKALCELARLLKVSTRGEDLVARLGGDEFALWLEGTDEAAAGARAGFLLDRARVLVPYSGGVDCPLGISLGIAVAVPGSGETMDELMARADVAMYASKKKGKGRATLADPPEPSRPATAAGQGAPPS
ncbi:MAG: hypothetical protein RL477_1910, partial [Pseudomonadota bacterium]